MADELLERLQSYGKTLFAGELGIRFTEATPERVCAELVAEDRHCTTPGIVHGGVIMSLADTLGGIATSLNLPPGAGTTTIESKTNFLGAAHPREKIRADCTAVHRGKRTMVWQTRVMSPDGRTLAIVTQTQMVLEPKPAPAQTLASLFQGKNLDEQKALLAQLERSGASVYRSFADAESNAQAREALLEAARREEENAELLERGG